MPVGSLSFLQKGPRSKHRTHVLGISQVYQGQLLYLLHQEGPTPAMEDYRHCWTQPLQSCGPALEGGAAPSPASHQTGSFHHHAAELVLWHRNTWCRISLEASPPV